MNGASCATPETALQDTETFQSASCTGSTNGSCTTQSTSGDALESGTYTLSGDMVTTTSKAGPTTNTISYCVMGSNLHFLLNSPMSLGPMGQAAIDEDTVAIKQ